jgi:putative peptidoglycan lipid II flippase
LNDRFHDAVTSSIGATSLSRILGGLRDICLASFFGAGMVSDAFYVAFGIPSALRAMVADDGLTGAVVPAVAYADGYGHDAKGLVNRLFTGLLLVNVVLCGLGVVFAEQLVWLFAAAFVHDPAKFELTVSLTRWMMPLIGAVSIVSFLEGVLNHRGHYFLPKAAPGLISAGVLWGLIACNWGGHSGLTAMYVVVLGLLLGAFFHVVIQAPMVRRVWGPIGLDFDFSDQRVRRAGVEFTKVAGIGVFVVLGWMVIQQLAAGAGDGAITWLWNATRLVELTHGVAVAAVGSAVLPPLASAAADRDWDLLRHNLHRALSLVGFMLIPLAALLLAFALPLVSLVFRHGSYTSADTFATSATLSLLIPYLLAFAAVNILRRVFFALNDRGPVIFGGLLSLLITAIVGWWMTREFGVPGLALAISVAACFELALYVALLRRRIPGGLGLSGLVLPFAQCTVAASPMTGFLFWLADMGRWENGPFDPLNLVLGAWGLTMATAMYLLGVRVVGWGRTE